MSDLNMVQLIGRLGADPEMKYTAGGEAIANLRVATGEKWKDKQTGEGKERTEWHRVVFFGRIAEVAGEYLQKGSQVYIQGQLRTRKWEDNDGNTRYSTEVNGRVMNMLGGKPSGSTQSDSGGAQGGGFRDNKPAPAKQDDAFDDSDIPF